MEDGSEVGKEVHQQGKGVWATNACEKKKVGLKPGPAKGRLGKLVELGGEGV